MDFAFHQVIKILISSLDKKKKVLFNHCAHTYLNERSKKTARKIATIFHTYQNANLIKLN